MIETQDITFRHAGGRPIGPFNLSVPARQPTLLLGASGSGKTTLLLGLAGLLAPERGTVRINGTNPYTLSEANRDRFRARTLAVVFQNLQLIPALSVYQNIALAGPVDPHLVEKLGLPDLMHRLPRQLSTGQAQRAAIARAMVAKPAVLLADEPTSALDDANAAMVARLLLDLSATAGTTLLVATHDQRLKDVFQHWVAL